MAKRLAQAMSEFSDSTDELALRRQWNIWKYLPRGTALAGEDWRKRHRGILALLWVHAALLPVFGLWRGQEPLHVLAEAFILPAFALAATWSRPGRRIQATIASAGLIGSSALLTHFSGGFIEAHFHFFVMVGVIALYQDWAPFTFAIGFVALHHGVVGTLWPNDVYNHPDAIANPWTWATIHAIFILGMSAACLVLWRANETAMKRMQSSEGQLAQAQQIAHLGSWNLDLATNRVTLSEELTKLLGFEATDASEPLDTLFRRVDPEDQTMVRGVLDRTMATGKPFETEFRVIVNGHTRWLYSRGQLIEDDENPRGIAGVCLDVTERRAALEERQKNLEQHREIERLREMDQFKTQFLNNAAHELGTPLTPIKLQMDLLRDQPPAVQEQSLVVIERNLRRMEGLVHDLLDAARAQSDRIVLRSEDTRLDVLVLEALESFRAMAQEREITITANPQVGRRVFCDPKRISQVLANLVSNAIKFTPVSGSVWISLTLDENEATVSVKDNGIGLTAEQGERLFEPFSRVHEALGTAIPGNGLGLFISQGIVEAHGGKLWALSDGPGKGSTFTFTLPIQVSVPALEPEKPVPPTTHIM